MLYMDTCLEVYPGYQRHRAAMHTVARFLDMEIWRVAETLSCRIKSHHRPRMYLVVPDTLSDKKSPNDFTQQVTPAQTAVIERARAMNSIAVCTVANRIEPGNNWQ